MVGSTVLVFLFAPEILRRVLQTQPLPDSPLRRRLEAMCRRVGMRYRDILLWHTQNNMGNAAVMGILPPVRYILLSDLLLERMDDEQIEAVFAHEVGHVVHRHMAWYVVVIMIFTLGAGLARTGRPPGHAARRRAATACRRTCSTCCRSSPRSRASCCSSASSAAAFERQADVYAARTMESSKRVQGSGFGGSAGSGRRVRVDSRIRAPLPRLLLNPEP